MELYNSEGSSTSEQQWILSDLIDGVDWSTMAESRFVFFPGLDSPGGDYLLVEGQDLEQACRRTPHCLGYNSNGLLKHSLQPPQQWVHWSDDPQQGLYVLDVNYCQMALQDCPAHSQCVRSAPANFSCQCELPYQPSQTGACELTSTGAQEEVRIPALPDRNGWRIGHRFQWWCHWTSTICLACLLCSTPCGNKHPARTD